MGRWHIVLLILSSLVLIAATPSITTRQAKVLSAGTPVGIMYDAGLSDYFSPANHEHQLSILSGGPDAAVRVADPGIILPRAVINSLCLGDAGCVTSWPGIPPGNLVISGTLNGSDAAVSVGSLGLTTSGTILASGGITMGSAIIHDILRLSATYGDSSSSIDGGTIPPNVCVMASWSFTGTYSPAVCSVSGGAGNGGYITGCIIPSPNVIRAFLCCTGSIDCQWSSGSTVDFIVFE